MITIITLMRQSIALDFDVTAINAYVTAHPTAIVIGTSMGGDGLSYAITFKVPA